MSVIRGEAISLRAAISSSVITSMRRICDAEDFQQVADLFRDLGHLGLDLLALQPGQACRRSSRMPRACSSVSRTVPSGVMTLPGSSISASSAPISPAGQSRSINATRAAAASGLARISRMTSSILATAMARPDQIVRPVARLAEIEPGTADDHFLAEADEALQRVVQPHLPRLAVVQRQHVDAETGLHLSEAVQLVQHDFRRGVAPQLDDDAHARAVALVAHLADAFDLLGAHQFRDALQQRLLVHLIRDLGDDDRDPILADFLELGAGADGDGCAPGLERGADAGAADDDAAGRKIRARNDPHQIVERGVRIGDQRQRGVDDFAWIVRRDIGRHADRDAIAAIDQQVGKPRRQDLGLLLRLVVVRLEIDGVLVDVVQQQHGRAGEPDLGVALRRRVVAVDRAEIALPVDQRHAHREGLRHAHQGVVDREIAVRVILAHHVADDARRFAVGRSGV